MPAQGRALRDTTEVPCSSESGLHRSSNASYPNGWGTPTDAWQWAGDRI